MTPTNETVERIVSAAIKYGDRMKLGTNHSKIVDSFKGSELDYFMNNHHVKGFWTNHSRFVDRKKGWWVAKEAGQLVDRPTSEGTLYSQDLKATK